MQTPIWEHWRSCKRSAASGNRWVKKRELTLKERQITISIDTWRSSAASTQRWPRLAVKARELMTKIASRTLNLATRTIMGKWTPPMKRTTAANRLSRSSRHKTASKGMLVSRREGPKQTQCSFSSRSRCNSRTWVLGRRQTLSHRALRASQGK